MIREGQDYKDMIAEKWFLAWRARNSGNSVTQYLLHSISWDIDVQQNANNYVVESSHSWASLKSYRIKLNNCF